MNNPDELNKTTLWIVIILITGIVGLLFYQMLIRDLILPSLQKEITQINEKCIECHTPSPAMAPGHQYDRIGCISCHMGNPGEQDKLAAHAGMISIPGQLDHAARTCGTIDCHPGIAERVQNSLMTSMSGVVTVQRFFFGESDSPDDYAHVRELGYSPADSYNRNLCASCHLGREKTSLGPVTELSRGGGCLACHLNYLEKDAALLAAWREGDPMHFHPSLSLNIGNEHCFGCHSRSGRISTNYEGWHETQLKEIPEKEEETYRRLEDQRIFVRIVDDVHHGLGMECIDCHSGMELMGDGKRYLHAGDAVKIQCDDCHFSIPPGTMDFDELDYESQKIIGLRKTLTEEGPFIRGHAGYPLVNVKEEKGKYVMTGKNTGKKYELSPTAEICTKGTAHDALSCSACHTAWAPQCIRCHVSFDPAGQGFDLLDRVEMQGKWIEQGGHFLAEAPTLGVMELENGKRRIQPFVPGMIIRADPSAYGPAKNKEPRFARLFAPIAAHTTRKEVRKCQDCHLDPNTLGIGRGSLRYEDAKKAWVFRAFYPRSPEDGLPEDAWTGLFENTPERRATRSNARPLNAAEQKRILSVGRCLQCHSENSELMISTLSDFEELLRTAMLSPSCEYSE